MMISYRSINSKTKALLKQHGKYEIAIDVFALVEDMGIELIFEPLPDGTSGLISIDENNTKIVVNENHHPNRQRFTAAHEIGHYELHRNLRSMFLDGSFSKGISEKNSNNKKTFHRDGKSHTGDNEVEVEANRYAAALIMPEELVFQEIKMLSIDLADEFDVKRLAQKFKVSEQAMTHRVGSLGISYMF